LLHRNDDAPSAGDNHVYACSIASTPSDTGYLLPTNLWVCIQLRRPDPDFAKISRVMRNFFFVCWRAGDDAGANHCDYGALRNWPVAVLCRSPH
jgi:hypothetical protein